MAEIECRHLWSAPTTAGTLMCAWCGKIIPAPIQYVSSHTIPDEANRRTPPSGEGG